MSDLLPFLVIGITTGSVYALSAVGLTLTYRTTGVFNFAQGAVGAAAAYVFYDLVARGMSWPLAALICVLGLGVVAGLLLERLGAILARVDVAMQIVATVGLGVALQALIIIRYGADTVNAASFLPTDLNEIAGTQVSTDQIIVMAVALGAVLALSALMRCSRFGTSARAVVDNAELLALTGSSPHWVRRGAWLIGSVFATAAGILAVVAVGSLDPTLLTLLLINAFGAAALGTFRSLPATYAGGLAVGIAAAVATKYITGTGIIAGLPGVIPVLVLFVVLLITPRQRLVTRSTLRRATVPLRALRPVRQDIGLGTAALAGLLLAPTVLGTSKLIPLTATMVFAILVLSLVLLVKFSGQVSLCQYGLAAVGAAAFYKLVGPVGLPWPLAVIAAGLVTVPVGALIAIPAIRLSGLFLALATLAFGVLLQGMFYTSELMFTQQPAVDTPRPGFAAGDVAYYRVTVVAFALSALLVMVIERTRLGRLLRGLEQSPTTMVAHGTNLNATKVIVFSLSAFLAGIAGALYGPIVGNVGPGPFEPLNSLTLLAILILAGQGALRPALIGGMALALIPSYITDEKVVDYLPVLYGVAATAIAFKTAAETSRSRGGPGLGAKVARRLRPAPAVDEGATT